MTAGLGRRVLMLGMGVLTIVLQGCASIVSGQVQVVSVETPGCEAARCELSNDKGKWFVPSTPGTVSIGRSYNNLQLVCSKGAYTGTPVSVASVTKGMAYGNALFGGLIGAAVDVGSGAAYDYPQLIKVPLQCAPDAAAAKDTATAVGPPRLGLRVVRASGPGVPGLLVAGVDPGSLAEQAGLMAGDVVVRANGSTLPEPETLAAIVAALREPWVLELLVRGPDGETIKRLASPAR